MEEKNVSGLPLISGKVEKPQRVVIYGAQLAQSDHSFKTLIIDTVDWLERLLIVTGTS